MSAHSEHQKYEYLHVLQGQYNALDGWEDLTSSEDRVPILSDLEAYNRNEPEYPHRIIRRRVLKEALNASTS